MAYEFRAAPRRRVKDDKEQPLFLKKLFLMITECPTSLGGWSENGEYFVVKDPTVFADKLIPLHYKHNNFSSFVRYNNLYIMMIYHYYSIHNLLSCHVCCFPFRRQLNFYGFRKIRSDLQSNHAQWWEFRHPNFVRGRPDLLSEIKRTVHYGEFTLVLLQCG